MPRRSPRPVPAAAGRAEVLWAPGALGSTSRQPWGQAALSGRVSGCECVSRELFALLC